MTGLACSGALPRHGFGIADQAALDTEVPGQVVERRDGGQRAGAVAVPGRAVTADGQAGPRFRKGIGQPRNGLCADAGLFRRCIRGIRRQRRRPGVAVLALVDALADNPVGHGQREYAFGARIGGNPLIGRRPAHRHPRLDLHEPSPSAFTALPTSAEAQAMMNRGQPGTQVVRAKGNQIVRVAEIVVGKLRRPEQPVHRRHQFMGVVVVVVHQPIRAHGGHELLEQTMHVSANACAQEAYGVALPAGAQFAQAPRKLRQAFGPGQRQPITGSALPRLPQRRGDAIRVVENLQPGLSPGAQPPLAHGMARIAFDLLGAALAGAHADAAARRAHGAHRVVPGGDARTEVFGRRRIGNQVFHRVLDRLAQHEPGTGAHAAGAHQFQEVSAVNAGHLDTLVPCSLVAGQAVEPELHLVILVACQAQTHLHRRLP